MDNGIKNRLEELVQERERILEEIQDINSQIDVLEQEIEEIRAECPDLDEEKYGFGGDWWKG